MKHATESTSCFEVLYPVTCSLHKKYITQPFMGRSGKMGSNSQEKNVEPFARHLMVWGMGIQWLSGGGNNATASPKPVINSMRSSGTTPPPFHDDMSDELDDTFAGKMVLSKETGTGKYVEQPARKR